MPTYAAIAGGFYYPRPWLTRAANVGFTINAATDKVAHIGKVHIQDRTASKTFGTSGSALTYATGAVTFANAGTTIRAGSQNVTGTTIRPDGTFDVYTDLVGGSATINANAYNTVAMASGTPFTVNHGDLLAFVFDMTGRGGADSVTMHAHNTVHVGTVTFNSNAFLQFDAGAWTAYTNLPNLVITFDDGTFGYVGDVHSVCTTTNGYEGWTTATNPDERGMRFTVPFNCQVDGVWFQDYGLAAATTWDLKLYSTPTSGATQIFSSSRTGSTDFFIGSGTAFIPITATDLTAGVEYGVTMHVTGGGGAGLWKYTLAAEGHRVLLDGGATCAKITRNNATGDFTAESPATARYLMAVRISAVDIGSGGAAGAKTYGFNGGFQ